jgi:CDP-diglyceride synthetase
MDKKKSQEDFFLSVLLATYIGWIVGLLSSVILNGC